MRAYLSFVLAVRHFRADLASMVLSAFAVALGVALVVAVYSMNATVLQGFLDTLDGVAGRASLTIAGGEGFSFSEELVEKVAAVRGVKLAVPLVRSVTVPDDGSGELLTVHGVDLMHDADVRLYYKANEGPRVIADPLLFLNTPESIILGREFAERRRLRIGDGIDLVTPGGVKRFVIRGLLDPEGLARTLRGRLIVMDLYAAERAYTVDGQINQIDVVVSAEAEVEATKSAIALVLPTGLTVEEPARRKLGIRQSLEAFRAMVSAFSLLAAVAGIVICYSRLKTIAVARTWEAGLLRAVGLPRRAVFAELLKQSLLLGMAGTSVGVPLGLLIAFQGVPFLAAATALNFRLPVPVLAVDVDSTVIVLGMAVGLGATFLSTVVPALQLARTKPAMALAFRGREIPPAHSLPWVLPAALVVAIVALIEAQEVLGVTALGFVTTGLMAATAALCAGPLVGLGAAGLTAVWSLVFGPAGRIAANQVRQNPGRSVLTVATLGLGLGTVLLFGMLEWSFERTLVSRLTAGERADMAISSAFLIGGYRTAPLSEKLIDELEAVPGVALAVGGQSKDIAYGDDTIVLTACDGACFTDPRVYEWQLAAGALPDALQLVADGRAVVVTTSFARRYGTRPGEEIELTSPGGRLTLLVAGISNGAPERAIWMTRHIYRRYWNDTTLWTANVVLSKDAEYAQVESTIAKQLGARYRLSIRSTNELIDHFAIEVRRAFSLQYLLETITLVLVAVAIGDTLATGVLERTREFGMMRAIGLSRAHLFGIVMLEGSAIGVLGIALAALTGTALGTFWLKVQFPALLGWDLDLHFPYALAALALGLTLLLCAAGSLLPALRAARLRPSAAIRAE